MPRLKKLWIEYSCRNWTLFPNEWTRSSTWFWFTHPPLECVWRLRSEKRRKKFSCTTFPCCCFFGLLLMRDSRDIISKCHWLKMLSIFFYSDVDWMIWFEYISSPVWLLLCTHKFYFWFLFYLNSNRQYPISLNVKKNLFFFIIHLHLISLSTFIYLLFFFLLLSFALRPPKHEIYQHKSRKIIITSCRLSRYFSTSSLLPLLLLILFIFFFTYTFLWFLILSSFFSYIQRNIFTHISFFPNTRISL